MPLSVPRRTSLIGDVITQLEAVIGSGEWPVGTRLPAEPELAAELGVGRSSVREAVRALVHIGVLQARQGDGTYVRATSGLGVALERHLRRADARHVLEARRGLEREAARLAAGRRTDDDLAGLEEIVARQRAAADAGDRDAFVAADVTFHRRVAAAAHSPVLAELLDHLGDAFADTVGTGVDAEIDHHRGDVATGLAHGVHDDLMDALRGSRPDEAGRASDAWVDHLSARLDPTATAVDR